MKSRWRRSAAVMAAVVVEAPVVVVVVGLDVVAAVAHPATSAAASVSAARRSKRKCMVENSVCRREQVPIRHHPGAPGSASGRTANLAFATGPGRQARNESSHVAAVFVVRFAEPGAKPGFFEQRDVDPVDREE